MAKRKNSSATAAEDVTIHKVILPQVKTVYGYNPNTGEYTGEAIASRCPVELDVYHIPAHATEVAPPEQKEDKARVWNGEKWNYVDLGSVS
jgi:hypothetical protein